MSRVIDQTPDSCRIRTKYDSSAGFNHSNSEQFSYPLGIWSSRWIL